MSRAPNRCRKASPDGTLPTVIDTRLSARYNLEQQPSAREVNRQPVITAFDQNIICPIFIGRSAHLEALERLVAQAKAGKGCTALVAGEAGIGKSRLAAEVRAHTMQAGGRIIQGNCFESDRGLPYAPLVDMLRTLFTGCARDDIETMLGATAPDLVKLLPELATNLPELKPTPALEPEQEKRRLFQSLAQFFVQLITTTGPLLVVVEDAHWSDDASLDFLHYFARRLSAYPILLLLTYRSDETHPAFNHFLASLDRERLAREGTLGRLGRDETEQLIRATFGQARAVRAEFLDAIHGLTDGNPFFIEEVLKSLVVAGEIFPAGGAWDRKPMSELHIPRSIQDALQQRTQHLSEPAKQLLALAAVAGRRCDFPLLQALTRRDESELLQSIKELIGAQLVVEESADSFAFRHALTRQAIYASLLSRERQTLHGRIAAALEHDAVSPSDAQLSDLAYHFYEAGVWDKALQYTRRAAEKARTMYAPRASVEQLTRALAAARHLALPPSAELLRARGQAHATLGDFEAARSDYEQALSAARTAGDQRAEWQSLFELGFLWTGRDYERAGKYLQRALALARANSDPAAVADSLNRLGNWQMVLDRPLESLRCHEEALPIFQALHDRRGLASTYDLLAAANFGRGDVATAARQLEQAVSLFRALGDRQGLSSSLQSCTTSSVMYLTTTSVTPVLSADTLWRDHEEALRIAREIDWRAGQDSALIFLAMALGPRGDYARAFAAAHAALEIAEEIEHGEWIISARLALGALYLDTLYTSVAVQQLTLAAELAKPIGAQFIAAAISHYLAAALSAQGEFARAESTLDALPAAGLRTMHTTAQRLWWCARGELALAQARPAQALEIFEELIASAIYSRPEPTAALQAAGRTESVIPRLWWLRAHALAALQRWAEAEATLKAARDEALRQGMPPLLWRIDLSLGRLYHATARAAEADDTLSAAHRTVDALAANLSKFDAAEGETFARGALALFPAKRPLTPRQTAKREAGGLTTRERELAMLIAEGKTNRDIAETLTLSRRTVEAHISNIMSKLDMTARAQIAVWAKENSDVL